MRRRLAFEPGLRAPGLVGLQDENANAIGKTRHKSRSFETSSEDCYTRRY